MRGPLQQQPFWSPWHRYAHVETHVETHIRHIFYMHVPRHVLYACPDTCFDTRVQRQAHAHVVTHVHAHAYTRVRTQLVATLETPFTFDAPLTTARVIATAANSAAVGGFNIAVSGGNPVTIHGLNFGSWDSSSSVRLGATACGCASWFSSTSIR